MALTTLEQNTINKGCAVAKKLVEELKPIIDQLNVIYDSDDGVKETVTQQDLDAHDYLSGLTKAQLDDGMFVITTTVKGTLTDTITQLSHLAARAS